MTQRKMEKREKRQARKKTPRPKRALKQSQPVSIKPGKSQVGRFRQLARAVAAILEVSQRADGSIEVPEVLRPRLGERISSA